MSSPARSAAARLAPAAQVLLRAQRVNARLGHENLGALSEHRGFVPTRAPSHALPASHRPWDEVAARLPELLRGLELRRVLERMPVLPAGPDALPDRDLLRAATVLGMLGHGCAWAAAGPAVLPPPSVAQPWQQVRRRLGRRGPAVLSYVDLIVHNWRTVDHAAPGGLRLADLRLLVPGVGSSDEDVFYLTQLEILARCAPVVGAVVAAQDGVLRGDDEAVACALETIAQVLGEVTDGVLPQIDPRPRSRTHVDPVTWAKTVAPFAVPLQPGVLGPSGTASPVFGLLDAFLGRHRHDSVLGTEIAQHRRASPPHWRALLDAVEQVPVPDHVARRRSPVLDARLAAVVDAYAGPDGFLGRHRRKVLGYLEVAFKVGRGVTIGGFTGAPSERAWRQVDDALVAAGTERLADGPLPAPSRAAAPPGLSAPRVVTLAELAGHCDEASGVWIALQGRVYDVSSFLDRHPGGPDVLRAAAGTDATAAFLRAHRDVTTLARRLSALQVGALHRPAPPDAWGDALLQVVELRNAFRLDRSFGRGTRLTDPDGAPPTPYVLDRAGSTLRRYEREHLPALATRVLAPLTGAGAPVTDRPRPVPVDVDELRRRLDEVDDALTAGVDRLRQVLAR